MKTTMNHSIVAALIAISSLNAQAADSTSVGAQAPIAVPACPNLPGYTSQIVPAGMTRDPVGNCVPSSAAAETLVDEEDFSTILACAASATSYFNPWGDPQPQVSMITSIDTVFTTEDTGYGIVCDPSRNNYSNALYPPPPDGYNPVLIPTPPAVSGISYLQGIEWGNLVNVVKPPYQKAKTVKCAVPQTFGTLPAATYFVYRDSSGTFVKSKTALITSTGTQAEAPGARYPVAAGQRLPSGPSYAPTGSDFTFTAAAVYPAGQFVTHSDELRVKVYWSDASWATYANPTLYHDGANTPYSTLSLLTGCSPNSGTQKDRPGYLMFDNMIMAHKLFLAP